MSTPPTWPEEIKWVYVLCHTEKEKVRFERVIKHLIYRGVPKDRIRVCGPTWGEDLDTSLIFKVYDPFLFRGNLPTFTYKSARLLKKEVSLALNFYAALKSTEDLSGSESVLFFESDMSLRRDFLQRLNETFALVDKKPWNYISLGGRIGNRPPGSAKSIYAPTKLYDPPSIRVFRCTDAMLLNADFVKKLATSIIPFKESLEWELNFQAIMNEYKSVWVDPPLAEKRSGI